MGIYCILCFLFTDICESFSYGLFITNWKKHQIYLFVFYEFAVGFILTEFVYSGSYTLLQLW
jgi:hypothetical protein